MSVCVSVSLGPLKHGILVELEMIGCGGKERGRPTLCCKPFQGGLDEKLSC